MKLRPLVLLSFVALLMLALVPHVRAESEIAVDPSTTARVRIIHASPDAPAVDVYVDGVKRLANVPFFTTSDYLTVPAGARSIQVTATGSTTPVITALANFAANTAYTVAAVGEVAAGSPNPIGPVVIVDNLNRPNNGFGQIRAYHFAPGIPPVQIRPQGGAALVSNLGFGAASSPLAVASGTYTLEVALASGGPTATALLTVPVTIESGKLYDFYAVGSGANVRIEARTTDASGFVRVIHASPDAPNVDVYVDNDKVLTNVPYFTISDYLKVPSGVHRFRVVPTGGPLTTPVIDQTTTIETQRYYTVSAVGLLAGGAQPLQAKLTVDDVSTPLPGTARVRVYHFSPGTPPVGVRIKGGAVLIPSLAFPNVSADLDVPAGNYDLEVFLVEGGATALTLEDVGVAPGKIYDIFARGVFPNASIQTKVYGPNGTPGTVIYAPIVTK